MSTSFSLANTIASLSVAGSLTETFNGNAIGLPASYAFNPAALTNGSGSGLAQLGTPGQLQLTAVTNPTGAPTLSTSASGGSIAAGTYTLQFTFYNGAGETIGSSTAQITTTGSASTITITAPTSLPSGATGINVYLTAGGSGTGKVGTAAANTVTITTLTPTGGLPSSTLSTATIAGTIDLTAVQSASKTFDFSGTDHGNGSGGSGGVKIWYIENTDTTVGQVITIGGGSNAWSNWLGGGTPTMGPAPAAKFQFDALGIPVTSINKIVTVQAKYNTPLIKYLVIGEGSWF